MKAIFFKALRQNVIRALRNKQVEQTNIESYHIYGGVVYNILIIKYLPYYLFYHI